ncbi:MAG: hypothetical protein R2798_10490 [Chitinophagales bacterium]|nr:type 1 periplasmic binding fold superfamily protein [Bacteroidota bacterium]MCB9044017.1 type 1 periplasmic binding fold superfamily protein [Chitinophagales bacterium]
MKNKFLGLLILSSIFFVSACKNEDPSPINEEELITNVDLVFTDENGNESIASFSDNDGVGGEEPTLSGASLSANTTYQLSIQLRNESVSPAIDITAEIEEEATDHQFFFLPDASLQLSVTYNDEDAEGHPIGLKNTAQTLNNSTGMLTIVLRHKPNKSAANVAEGSIDNAAGETDVEVSFPITIQ